LIRHIKWHADRTIKYAVLTNNEKLPCVIAEHHSPLYRKLKDVDMWLQDNKVVNLKIAIAKINNLILKPGETFSFWRLVGKPTQNKGYLKGMVLMNGTFHPGIGGGLCQLSNLIYWMTLHTPLTVTERWRHTHDIFPDANRTQPFGSGATVVYNYVDLQIRNDTRDNYQLILSVDETDLHGKWRSEKLYPFQIRINESDHIITHEWWGGYMRHNIIRKQVLDRHNAEISNEVIAENHAIMMYEPFLQDSSLDIMKKD
jgi:vancomycin resistance protein VanW